MEYDPNFLSPNLVTLADHVRQLIQESRVQSLLPEWRRIHERMGQPAFSVAVAGEFSRGKSTLVNRLLGQDLLPVGDLPTTAMLTSVRYGPEAALWRIHGDGRREKLALGADSWNSLIAKEEGTDPEGVLQIDFPHPWLKQTGIQILDLPGAGDLTGLRAAIAMNAIASSDAALVVVSATMALSLTERAFVEEQVLGRHIPRVAVVLTRLDQVVASQRASVIAYAKDRLREWAPKAILCCVHSELVEPEDVVGVVAGPDAILALLTSWGADDGHKRLRTAQTLGQLSQLVTLLANTLTMKREAMLASEEERRQLEAATETQLSASRLSWEDIRLELEQREIQHGKLLEESVSLARVPLLASLNDDLGRASDPREWSRTQLPYRLRRELLTLGRSVSEALQGKLEGDAEWINGQLQKRFSWKWKPSPHQTAVDISADYSKLLDAVSQESDQPPSADYARLLATAVEAIQRSPMATKQGAAVLVAAGLLFPPIRLLSFGTVLAGVVLSKGFEGPLGRQKKELAKILEAVVDDAVQKGTDTIKDQMRVCYRAMLDETRRQEEKWFAARSQAIDQAGTATTEDRLQIEQQLKQAGDLLTEFRALTKGATP